jgi:hypothetical protein
VTEELLKLAGSIIAILFLAWLARHWQLGGDVRIRSEEQARSIADEIICGFEPVDIAIDKAGIRLDQNFLTVGTGERTFGTVTLNLGERAQYWAAGLRHLQV